MKLKKFISIFEKRIHFFRFKIEREKLLNHKLIFCINSGRSGSNYLATLLATGKNVSSYHEPEPTMTKEYLQMINMRPYQESFEERKIKINGIKNILCSLPKGEIYCETNHMFIKTFFDVVLSEFNNVEVIILRRELALVLKSFLQLDYFSDRNEAWPNWMSSPNAKTAALKTIGSDQIMDQCELCIAYLFDIEARAMRFKQDYPWVKTHELRLEKLSEYSNVEKLFANLNITITDETKEIFTKKINQRDSRKKDFNKSISLEYCRERITQYIDKAESMGILLPSTLALNPYKS